MSRTPPILGISTRLIWNGAIVTIKLKWCWSSTVCWAPAMTHIIPAWNPIRAVYFDAFLYVFWFCLLAADEHETCNGDK